MSNDLHWDPIAGKMRAGLNQTYEELLAQQDLLAAKINVTLQEMPVLKGIGFIVVSPASPRFDGDEFEKVEDAQERAAEVAYQGGSAIIYAPISVVKPRRDTVSTVPSKLMAQIGAANAAAAGLPAGGEIKPAV